MILPEPLIPIISAGPPVLEGVPRRPPAGFGATGDRVPLGCTCKQYISVTPPPAEWFSPGNPPSSGTKKREVCVKIDCNGVCLVLQVVDKWIKRACNCSETTGNCEVPPGDFAAPKDPVSPPGVKCGWPNGYGQNKYGFRHRSYRWLPCNGNSPIWPDGEVVPPPTNRSHSTSAPRSAGSVSTYNYVNMVYHGFYGGTSLQSQELNELQENIQNQLSLSNKLTGNWLEYNNNSNIHGETLGGIYTAYGLTADIFIPLNPKNIEQNTTTTYNDWYLYKDNHGYEQFIILQHEIVSHLTYYNNIESRIVSSQDPNWAILRDTNNTTTFDGTGAHRIQLYYPYASSDPYTSSVVPPVSSVDLAYGVALNMLEQDGDEIIARFQ